MSARVTLSSPTTLAPRTRTSKVPIAGGDVIVRAMARLERRLAVARGDEPADLVVRGGRVLCVFTREWLDADVAIADGVIAGLGAYDGNETIDATGRFVVPGFIDAHMHLESVKLLVDEFARLVLPLGTTAVVADPHEIANVLGADGVHWLLDASAELQLEVFFMAPSCVPASPFESPRRPLAPGDLEALMRRSRVLGLAEMMNFPGVVAGAAVRAREARARRAPSTSTATRPGCSARRSRRTRQPGSAPTTRPDRRGGPRAAPRRDVAADPRGVDGAQPPGAAAARARVRAEPDRVLHRRPRPRGHRRRTATSTGWCARRSRSGSRRRMRSLMASFHPAQWHGLHRLGAVAPGYQADLLLLPDLEQLRARPRAEARPPDRGRAVAPGAGLGPPDRPGRARHGRGLRDPARTAPRSARSA